MWCECSISVFHHHVLRVVSPSMTMLSEHVMSAKAKCAVLKRVPCAVCRHQTVLTQFKRHE